MSWIQRTVIVLAVAGLVPLYLTAPRYAVDHGTRYNVTGTTLEFMGSVDPATAGARLVYYLVGAGLLLVALKPRCRRAPDAA